jgi:hypothetical protein
MALSDLLALARASDLRPAEMPGTHGTHRQHAMGSTPTGPKTAVSCGSPGAGTRGTHGTHVLGVSQGSEGPKQAVASDPRPDLLDVRPPEPPPLPPIGTPERDRRDREQAVMVSGLMAVAVIRPPSWWHAAPHLPMPAATCSCCRGRRWWTRDRRGWCCVVCHPAPAAGFTEVMT